MQINNNVQSPNFGMALKIKCSAKNLENAGVEVIERLSKAADLLKKYGSIEI